MSSLSDFGIAGRDVVRQPTRDHEGLVCCPECGQPVGGTEGSQKLVNPELVDTREIEVGNFVTLGYRCDRHGGYEVVIPKPCGGERAANFPKGWRAVRVRYADDLVRWVAVPEREVRDL